MAADYVMGFYKNGSIMGSWLNMGLNKKLAVTGKTNASTHGVSGLQFRTPFFVRSARGE